MTIAVDLGRKATKQTNKDQSVRYVNYVTDLFAQCSLYKNTI